MPLVSVIIPVYNVEQYLRQCIDSVRAQTLFDIEIICVNDSSTDGSLKILEEYAQKDERIKVVTQPNGGAGAARNRGLSMDFFEPEMLELAYQKAEEDRADFVVFNSDQYYTDKKKFINVSWTLREKELPPYTPFNHRQMTDNIFKVFVGWAWDKLYNKEFVEKNHLLFQEQRTSNDLLFVFSAVAIAKRISVVNKILAHQRRDAKDSLSKTRENSWYCFYDALVALRDRLKEEDIYKETEKDYINYALHAVLWNINALEEPTRSRLIDRLEKEWLEDLGIKDKPKSYFYNEREYKQYKKLL